MPVTTIGSIMTTSNQTGINMSNHENHLAEQVSAVYKKIDNGTAVFVEHEEAKRLMQPTTIRITPSLKMKVEAIAKKEGRSFSNMMNRIIESHFN